MLKTILTKQVKLGMHIHELKGAWVDHPFWKTKFLLNDPADLKKLQNSVIKQVVIDIAKGEDADNDKPIEVQENIKTVTQEVVESKRPIRKVSAAQETKAAKRVIAASRRAVTSMFNSVRMGKVLSTEAIMPLVNEISASIDRNKGALISLARLKTQDDYTYMHSVAVCALMTALAKELALTDSEVKQAGIAGLMHDLGKATIPIAILNKPGALTNEEFDQVKKHPENGHQLLVQAGITDPIVLDVCLHHHEKLDGKGYPDKLSGKAISLFARMGAICDVYDAITSDRPYKNGWAPADSIKKWLNGRVILMKRCLRLLLKVLASTQ